MSDVKFEQHCAIKFSFRFGQTATKALAKFQQAYGDDVLSRAQVFWWFKAFSEGRESIEDEPYSRRPSTSRNFEDVDRVRDLVRSDHWFSIRMIREKLNLNIQVVHQILTEGLDTRKICAKMVPKIFFKIKRTSGAAIFWNTPQHKERVL